MRQMTVIEREQRKLEREHGGVLYTWRESSCEIDGSGAIYDYTIVKREYACGRRVNNGYGPRRHIHSGQCGHTVIKSGQVYVSFS